MSTVCVIGNCHLSGVVRAFKFFDSALLVESCSFWELAKRFDDGPDVVDYLRRFDRVFTSSFDRTFLPGFDSDVILTEVPGSMSYPTVHFGAFHPDVVIVPRSSPLPGPDVLTSPLGPYNSALVVYGYLKGYTPAATAALFRGEVYEQLGYLTGWKIAVEEQLKDPTAKAFGFDQRMLAWLRDGCFMHTPTHPKVGVIIDIAAEMLQRAGFSIKHADARPFIPDDLLTSIIWPVYPEIGKFYGLPGHYTFKRDSAPTRWPEFMTLDEFVDASYEIYDLQDVAHFTCQRVEHWIASGMEL